MIHIVCTQMVIKRIDRVVVHKTRFTVIAAGIVVQICNLIMIYMHVNIS